MPSLLNTLTDGVAYDTSTDFKATEEASKASSFSEKFSRAMLDESALAMSIGALNTSIKDDAPEDVEFMKNNSLKEDLYKQYSADIKPEFKSYIFENSKNLYDFKDKLEFYKKQSNIEDSIDSLGLGGSFALRMGGALPDVIPLVIGTISAPITATAIGSSFVARTVLGGTLATTAELIRRNVGDRERTNLESGISIALGTAVASAFGRASADTINTAKNSIKRTLKYDKDLEEQIIKAEKGELKNADGTKITVDDIISAKAKEVGLSETQYKSFKAVFNEIQKEAEKKNFDEGFASMLRVDLAHLTKKSPSASMAKFGEELFPDSTLQTNVANKTFLAEMTTEVEKRIQQSVANNFAELINRYGSLVYGKGVLRTRFSNIGEEVSQLVGSAQVKRTLGIYSKNDALKEVTDNLLEKGIKQEDAEKLANDLVNSAGKVALDSHQTLKEYGKSGFVDDSIKTNEDYMPIVYSFATDEILKARNFNQKDFSDFLKNSIISKMVKDGIDINSIPENSLKDMAISLASKLRKNEYRDVLHNKSLKDILLDTINETGDMPTSFKESISTFARTRTPFDYSYVATKTVGDNTTTIGFNDLVNKDFFNIYNQYSKKMGGATSLEKMKFTDEKIIYDFAEANRIKSSIVNIIKNQNELGKMLDRLTGGKPITTEAIFNIANKLYPMVGKTIDDVLGRAFKHEDLSTMSEQEAGELFSKLLSDFEKTISKKINDNIDEIDSIIPDSLMAKADELKEFAKDSEKFFRDKASIVHARLDTVKDNLTKEEYDTLFKEEYQKEITKDVSGLDILNTRQKDIFTTKEVKQYDLSTDEGINKYRNKIAQELKDSGVTGRIYQKELDRFDEIIKEMKGLPTAVNPNSLGMQTQRTIRNMNIARLLGQTAFTMSAELGSVVMQTGIKNFIEFAPQTFKGIIKQIKTGKIDSQLAQEIQTFMGIGGDLYKAIGIGRYEHDFNILQMNNARAVENFSNRAEAISEKFAEATLLFGGVKPLTNFFQMTTAMSTVNDLFKLTSKEVLTKNDAKFLNEMGIDIDMLGRISKQIKKHGSFKEAKWSNGHKVNELGYEKWDDAEAQRVLVTGIRRLTDTVVQQSNSGDKIGTMSFSGRELLRNTFFGKLALELKDYMITAYVKQFGRAYSRRDMFMFGTIMAQAGFLTISKILQNQINYAGNDDKREEAMKPEKIAQSVIANIPMSSYIPMMVDPITDTLFGERYLSDGRYHSGVQSGTMSLPSLDFAIKLEQLLKAVPETIREGEVSNKSVNALFGLAPMGNTVPIKTVHQALLKD